MNWFTGWEVLFPLMNSVFLGPSMSCGYFFLAVLIDLIVLGSLILAIVDEYSNNAHE
jgi:hypothetical protein